MLQIKYEQPWGWIYKIGRPFAEVSSCRLLVKVMALYSHFYIPIKIQSEKLAKQPVS